MKKTLNGSKCELSVHCRLKPVSSYCISPQEYINHHVLVHFLYAFLDIFTDQLRIRGASIRYHLPYRTVSNLVLALGKAQGTRLSEKLPNLVESGNNQQVTWWASSYLGFLSKNQLYTFWELCMACDKRVFCGKSYSFIHADYGAPKTTLN